MNWAVRNPAGTRLDSLAWYTNKLDCTLQFRTVFSSSQSCLTFLIALLLPVRGGGASNPTVLYSELCSNEILCNYCTAMYSTALHTLSGREISWRADPAVIACLRRDIACLQVKVALLHEHYKTGCALY